MVLERRLPAEADLVRLDSQGEATGRQVRGGAGIHPIIMRAGRERAPLAGLQHFHFAVHDFHGHGALVAGAGKASLRDEGVGEREQHADHQGHRHEQLDHERAAAPVV